MKSYPLGTLRLENDRLYLKHTTKGSVTTVDVTPVWHFFNEVNEFIKEPLPPSDEMSNVVMKPEHFKYVADSIEKDTAEQIIGDYMEALGTVQLPKEVWLWIADINGKYLNKKLKENI